MAQSSTFTYDQHVVVAEAEWKLRLHFPPVDSKNYVFSEEELKSKWRQETFTEFCTHFGGFEWQCTFTNNSTLKLECNGLGDSKYKEEVHLELFIYTREKETEQYASRDKRRVILTTAKNSVNLGFYAEFVLINARILKERDSFPDFTLEKPIGHLAANCKLKVGETIFLVNKQWLAIVSPYFNRMFYGNGGFVEEKQDVIETGETDAAAYHDFLVAICPVGTAALPNSQNLAQLYHLAHYYEVDSLREKLANSLKLCREMPKEERIKLAAKMGDKELQKDIALNELYSLKDAKRFCADLIDNAP